MKSPKINSLLVQKDNFFNWLKEWEIEKKLSGMSGDEESTCLTDASTDNNISARINKAISPFSSNVKIGQIRLFSPSLINSDRPRYFTILKSNAKKYLIATYSIFSSPAMPGEIITGRDHFSFRILQVWNNILLPKDAIAQSWLIDELSEKELKESQSLYESIIKKTKAPDTLLEKSGFPIIGINDPRIEYRKAEMAVFATLKHNYKSSLLNDDQHKARTNFEIVFPCEELSIAAKDKKTKAQIFYSVPGKRIKIQLYCDKKRKSYCFDVVDLKGEKSDKLDGCHIQSGSVTKIIAAGYTELDMERSRTVFRLNDINGKPIDLKII
jgi:hypothetical protein